MMLLALVLGAACAFAQPVKTRHVAVEYTALVRDVPPGETVELWLPVPRDDVSQTIRNWKAESPAPYRLADSPDGNRMLHTVLKGAGSVRMSFEATRREHRSLPSQEDVSRHLQPDRLVPLDAQIRSWAREVVTAAHAKSDMEMARAIYNHVVATVKYDKSGKGWGRGDIYYACDARRGNCTDFHAIFIGYTRAVGIPARFAVGIPLPAEHGAGRVSGYHCWAEFYAKGVGWVPIDASEAAKNPARREYFFGAHDENRIEFSRHRDLQLTPPQRGEPLNFFIDAYAEIKGQRHPAETQVSYRDLP